jgi:hypothetical protein
MLKMLNRAPLGDAGRFCRYDGHEILRYGGTIGVEEFSTVEVYVVK